MAETDRFDEQMRAAHEAMHRYRHALRALATGETIDEAREAMEREATAMAANSDVSD
ncbi:MAG TPA: hypothetical protein VMY41_05075 [Thermohalobaculum sp.]|nr:hypothetical protein [Thermohalobaculum sp.]